MSLLEVRGLEVRYGGIRAVQGIDLEIAAGELVCLIGANGAGKSSTLRALSGLAPAAPGSIRFEGRDLAGVPAFARARAGLVMVPEGRGVFAQLSVEENLVATAANYPDRQSRWSLRQVFDQFPQLAVRTFGSASAPASARRSPRPSRWRRWPTPWTSWPDAW